MQNQFSWLVRELHLAIFLLNYYYFEIDKNIHNLDCEPKFIRQLNEPTRHIKSAMLIEHWPRRRIIFLPPDRNGAEANAINRCKRFSRPPISQALTGLRP